MDADGTPADEGGGQQGGCDNEYDDGRREST
jgi:hypothetical protein